MGLLTKEVEVVVNSRNVKYYEDLGYDIPKYYNKNKKKPKEGKRNDNLQQRIQSRSNPLIG